MTPEERLNARARALGWATNKYNGKVVKREDAIGEEHLALDVLELIDEATSTIHLIRGMMAGADALRAERDQLRAALMSACGMLNKVEWSTNEWKKIAAWKALTK